MNPILHRQWRWRSSEPDVFPLQGHESRPGLSTLAARALHFRGICSAEDAEYFLQARLADLPDPFLLPGMDTAVQRLIAAIERGEKILVHGDYDVDGITGTTLLYETLQAMGAQVEFYIPLRLKDGYGLCAEALNSAAGRGIQVVVSVDCGISAYAEAQLAAQLGLDLIITDHHQPPESLPPAVAIVNPCLPGHYFPGSSLAGVGVAFFLLIALRKALRSAGHFTRRPEPDLRHSLDLVALGTIADIVPLVGINRILTRAGLGVLNCGSRPGIRALQDVAGVKEITCGAVGFRLAPRLNAAGRLEDAALGVKLLLDRQLDSATEVARLLDGFNRERQQIEEETLGQAVERLEAGEGKERTIVLADERWHPGVIGIVASRLVERYHRPVVLIALDGGKGKGSARSIRGFHLYRALAQCGQYLEGFGGHEYAAGLTIEAEEVAAFSDALESVALATLSREDLHPSMYHDGEIQFDEITMEAVKDLAQLAPFGAGNPEPVFMARGLRVQQLRDLKGSHLKFVARQGGYTLPCIAFGMAERKEELLGEADLLFSPALNEWGGRSEVQLKIKDFRPSTRED